MSVDNEHNLLSAYLDDELTPSQRRELERRLEESPELQAVLKRLQDVGHVLRELPTAELPAEFAATVLQRCERESLLAGDHGADDRDSPGKTAEPRPAGMGRPRSWLALGGSLVATAAALFLVVQAVSQNDPTRLEHSNRRNADRTQVNADQTQPELARNEQSSKLADQNQGLSPADRRNDKTAKPHSKNDGSPRRGTKRIAKRLFKKSQPPPRQNANSGTSGSRGRSDKGKKPLRFGATDALKGSFDRKSRFAFGNKNLHGAFRIGEVVPYLEVSGGRTAVIEVTVIDVQNAVGRLEVLLQKSSVPPLEGRNAKTSRTKPPNERKLPEKAGGKQNLFAVYVESTQPQLAAVMRELGKSTGSVHLSLKPPVALGDVRLDAQTDGSQWVEWFRRDRRRAPVTLADAAEFSRQRINAAPGGDASQTQRRNKEGSDPQDRKKSPPENPRPATRGRDDAEGSPKTKKQRPAPQPGNKPGVKRPLSPSGQKRTNRKRSGGSRFRSFQLRLLLADRQPIVSASSGKRAESRTGKPDPRKSPAASRNGKTRKTTGKQGRVTKPLRVIFVFREQTNRNAGERRSAPKPRRNR